MESVDKEALPIKLAEALLLCKGKISIKDIEAMPFLDDPKDADLIVSYLINKFKTKVSAIRIQRDEINAWEELITLEEK